MGPNDFEIAIATHRGRIKEVNEDNGTVQIKLDPKGLLISLCAVADGMGGLESGDIASRIAIDYLNQWWDQRIESPLFNSHKTENLQSENKIIDLKSATQEIGNIFNKINYDLIQKGKQIGKRLGTTLSVLFNIDSDFIVISIGDSRIYRLNKKIEQLTEDHSWVAQQIRNGKMTKEEATNHPSRHILTECLGVNDKIHLYFNSGRLYQGDTYVLCSDGFYTMVLEQDWANYIQAANTKKQRLQLMANTLTEMANNAGGQDNITIVLVRWNKPLNWFDKFFS